MKSRVRFYKIGKVDKNMRIANDFEFCVNSWAWILLTIDQKNDTIQNDTKTSLFSLASLDDDNNGW